MATVLSDPKKIVVFQMRSQLAALGMEIKGFKHSSGRSVSAFIKQQYGIKKRKKVDVWKAFHQIILDKEDELKIERRELNRTEKQILEM